MFSHNPLRSVVCISKRRENIVTAETVAAIATEFSKLWRPATYPPLCTVGEVWYLACLVAHLPKWNYGGVVHLSFACCCSCCNRCVKTCCRCRCCRYDIDLSLQWCCCDICRWRHVAWQHATHCHAAHKHTHRVSQKVKLLYLKTHIFAYVFRMPQPISMIYGTLQRHFSLNTIVDSKFIKFIKQSGAAWWKLITLILLSTNTKGS